MYKPNLFNNKKIKCSSISELKRRKVDSSLKKSLDDVPIILDDTKKERVSKSKDRKEKSWDDGEVRKEKKASRKRESKTENSIKVRA